MAKAIKNVEILFMVKGLIVCEIARQSTKIPET